MMFRTAASTAARRVVLVNKFTCSASRTPSIATTGAPSSGSRFCSIAVSTKDYYRSITHAETIGLPGTTSTVPTLPSYYFFYRQQQQHRWHTSFSQRVATHKPSITLGCVCYDPAVGDIWGGIQSYLKQHKQYEMDYVLFTNYEAQVRALLGQHIDVAWNGPVAHVMCEELVPSKATVVSLGMRDVDRNVESIVIVRRDANITTSEDLNHKHIVTGASDSPQAHLVPLYALRNSTDDKDATAPIKPGSVTAMDLDLGKHGDTATGEIAALQALSMPSSSSSNTKYHAALVSRMMWDRASSGKITGINADQIQETCEELTSVKIPAFDHCQFDALLTTDNESKLQEFGQTLLTMDMKDPEQERLMKLEGIAQHWVGPRQGGYDIVRKSMRIGAMHRTASNLTYPSGTVRSFSTTTTTSAAPKRRVSTNYPQAPNRIAVIGAGLAGLQAIRALKGKGLSITAIEASSNVGGLWQSNYVNFGVQVPKQLYEFPDYPMNSVKWGEYATGPQVQDYLETYANVFDLKSHIQFNTRVTNATRVGSAGWKLEMEHGDGQRSTQEFDYLVAATGLYSGLNKVIPPVPGLNDKFQGKVVHSTDFTSDTATQLSKNQRVVVIGGGKSAVDCAIEAARAGATSTTLLQRAPHWPTPRKIAGVIPFQYIFLSRFGTALISAHQGTYPGGSGPIVNAFRNTVGPYVVKPVFRLVEELFALQFGLKGDLRPKQDIVADFYDVALVLDSDLRELRNNGKVQVKLGEIQAVPNEGKSLLLKDGSSMEADVIVSATGFDQDYEVFDQATQQDLDLQSDGIYLHRYILPERVPNLAFIGHVGAISNISSYGLQAEWLARYLTGDLVSGGTPDRAEIEARKAWARSWMPESVKRGMMVLLHQTHYHDQLLRDMGENPLRKSNALAEYLMPYEPSDYNGIIGGLPKPV